MAIKVNLLPREAAPARAGIAIRAPRLAIGGGLIAQIASVVLVVIVLGLGVLGYMAWSTKAQYEKDILDLKAKSDQLKAQLVELQSAEEAKRDIQRRLDIVGKVAKSQGVPVAMMNGVLKAVPQGVWLTSFEMKPQEVRVKVETGRAGPTDVTRVLDRLEAKRQEVGTPVPLPGSGPAPAAGKVETKEVMQLQGFLVTIKGLAFNNLQLVDFMENLRKAGVFADVDFVVTQAERVEQTRVMNFEVTATVKL